jgi:hypothetical protein
VLAYHLGDHSIQLNAIIDLVVIESVVSHNGPQSAGFTIHFSLKFKLQARKLPTELNI